MEKILLVVTETIYEDVKPFIVFLYDIKEAKQLLCGVTSYMIIDLETHKILESYKFVPVV